MPDLSILVELAEFYDIEIRELLNGERSQTMNKEMKETLNTENKYPVCTSCTLVAFILKKIHFTCNYSLSYTTLLNSSRRQFWRRYLAGTRKSDTGCFYGRY